MKEFFLRKNLRYFSDLSDLIQTIIIYLLAFLIPAFTDYLIVKFFSSNKALADSSVIIIETLVNILIILFALNLKGVVKSFLMATISTLGIFIATHILGTVPIYYAYITPFIGLANLLVISSIKYFMFDRKIHFLISVIPGFVLKIYLIVNSFTIIERVGYLTLRRGTIVKAELVKEELIAFVIATVITFIISKLEYKKDMIK